MSGADFRRRHLLRHAHGLLLVLALSIAKTGSCEAPTSLPAGVRQLHDDLIVVDGHVHMITRMFHTGVDPWWASSKGTFDYARARQGGLDVVIESIYVEDAYNRYNYSIKQALRLIETFYRVLDANGDKMALALDARDVRRIVAEGKMAVVLALEGGMDMEGDLDVLRMYHRLGVRMIQLTGHSNTNALVDSTSDKPRWNGLSDRGRAVICEMNRLGIIVDISHASDEGKSEIIAASGAPVVTSHNGLRHFSAANGNLTDQHVKELGARGGLIGLHAAGWLLTQDSLDWGFHRPRTDPPPPWTSRIQSSLSLTREPIDYGDYLDRIDELMAEKWVTHYSFDRPWRELQDEAEKAGAPLPTVDDWVAQADYIVRMAGPDHVSLGLDLLDGGNWLKDFDATAYPRITAALLKRGYSVEAVAGIMGENWLRLLESAKSPYGGCVSGRN